ncbi:MAG: RNA 2'-phosphotransferase [Polyangiaceae bacterium]
MDRNIVSQSKRVSWLLRHGAAEAGVAMDGAGWVLVSDVLRALRMSEAQLEAVVGQNDKQRFERSGDRIRASQGHSVSVLSVEALEASWKSFEGDGPVFHGTNVGAAFSIAREGITAQKRSHVHLAASRESKVGKRWNVEVLLVVSPARVRAHGIGLFESPNGVILARRIPVDCITGVESVTRGAQEKLAALRAAFKGG